MKRKKVSFTRHKTEPHRRHYIDEEDVKTVLSRLPDEVLIRLHKVHFSDHAKGRRRLGYTTRDGRREITLCALPLRVSLGQFQGAGIPETFGALKGSQWPVLAVRRFMLYDVLLHEIGHLQVILPKAKNVNRKFASEGKAQEFAVYWRKKLWSEYYEHPDPVHNAPSDEEINVLKEGWIPAHNQYKKGLEFVNSRDFQQAVDCYMQALTHYSGHSLALTGLGILTYRMSEMDLDNANWEEAAELLRNAIVSDPAHHEATFWLAMTLHELDDWEEADKMFKRAISLDPYLDIDKIYYAKCLGERGECNRAETIFKKLLKKDPRNCLVLHGYAEMLMYKSEEIDDIYTNKAIGLLEVAVEEKPDKFKYVCLLGIAHAWLKNHDLALKYGQDAKRLRPDLELPEEFSIYTFESEQDQNKKGTDANR